MLTAGCGGSYDIGGSYLQSMRVNDEVKRIVDMDFACSALDSIQCVHMQLIRFSEQSPPTPEGTSYARTFVNFGARNRYGILERSQWTSRQITSQEFDKMLGYCCCQYPPDGSTARVTETKEDGSYVTYTTVIKP
jgi:hypothetical protein